MRNGLFDFYQENWMIDIKQHLRGQQKLMRSGDCGVRCWINRLFNVVPQVTSESQNMVEAAGVEPVNPSTIPNYYKCLIS
jgi:hypothetical protein